MPGPAPLHGGPDAQGAPEHDLSTNANACGPCPLAVRALERADARRYPDPAYTRLRALLGQWHGVAAGRIFVAASGSEFIQRLTAAVALQGAAARDGGAPPAVWLPRHAYGDYARAAQAHGLPLAAYGPASHPARWASRKLTCPRWPPPSRRSKRWRWTRPTPPCACKARPAWTKPPCNASGASSPPTRRWA